MMPVSTSALQQMAIYLGIVSGGGCAVMYYLIQPTAEVPEDWRTANVVLLLKKGNRDKSGNYRPVNLAAVGKIHQVDTWNEEKAMQDAAAAGIWSKTKLLEELGVKQHPWRQGNGRFSENFAKSEYYKLAIEELKKNDVALAALGAPPLQIRNIKLTDRNNRVDGISARIKIPVCGNKSAGYLHTYCVRDTVQKRWFLQEAVLQFLDGQEVSVYSVNKDEDQS